MSQRAAVPRQEADTSEAPRHDDARGAREASSGAAPNAVSLKAAAGAGLRAADLLAVQRAAGNQAATSLVRDRFGGPRIQRDGPVASPELGELHGILEQLDDEIATGLQIEIPESDQGEGGEGGEAEADGAEGDAGDAGGAGGEAEAEESGDGDGTGEADGGEGAETEPEEGDAAGAGEAGDAVDVAETEPPPPPAATTGEVDVPEPETPEPIEPPELDTGEELEEDAGAPPDAAPGTDDAGVAEPEADTILDSGTGGDEADDAAAAAEAEAAGREFRQAAEAGEREEPPTPDVDSAPGGAESAERASERREAIQEHARERAEADPVPVGGGPEPTPAEEPSDVPGGGEGPEPEPEPEGGGGGGDLLPAAELVEHERWGVGEVGSAERARFTASQIGAGFGQGAYNSATTGTLISLGTLAVSRLAARRLPVPVVGSIISGIASGRALGGQIYDLFTEEGGGSVGRSITGMAEGGSGYERAANIIDGIITILDIAGSVVDIVGGVAGLIAAIGWTGVIPSFGASSPVAVKATAIAAKCLIIAGIIGAVKIALQPIVVTFRALHTFTDTADPEEVAERGQALEQSASALGSQTVSLARSFGTRRVEGGIRRVRARAWQNREARAQAAAAGLPPPRPRPLVRFRRDAADRQTEVDYIRHRENQRVDRLYDRLDRETQRINGLEQSGRIDPTEAARLRNDLYNRTFTLQGQAEQRADTLAKQATGEARPTTRREQWRQRAGTAVDALGNVGSSPSGGIKLWAGDVGRLVGAGASEPAGDAEGQAPVNPDYPSPPATQADLDQLDHEAEVLDAQSDEAREDADAEEAVREEHEENADVLSDIDGAADAGAAARGEHATEVDDKQSANEQKADQVDESAGQLEDGSTEIAAARGMIPLMTGWRMAANGAASVLGIFSDRGAAKCREAAADAQRFIDQLNEAIVMIEAERAATPARQAETAAEAAVIDGTRQQGERTDEEIEQTQEAAGELHVATDEEIANAQENQDAAESAAAEAAEGADDARSRRDQLEGELNAWASEHAAARHDAAAQIADDIAEQGYTVTERPTW